MFFQASKIPMPSDAPNDIERLNRSQNRAEMPPHKDENNPPIMAKAIIPEPPRPKPS